MATSNVGIDKYANMLAQALTLSAANTLTFGEINIGLNLFDKVGLLLQRIEVEIVTASLTEMTADGDYLRFGLTQSNQVASLDADKPEVIDAVTLRRGDFGAAAAASYLQMPLVHDFSSMMGGGILIAPKPLYVGGVSSGLASAARGLLRMYFSIVKLADADYFELLQTRRVFS